MPWADTDPSRRRGYHVGNLRAQLLDQARLLLDEGGPAKLNLRALAARAGVAPGSVYHHYESKNALLAGLAAEGFREMEAALRDAAANSREGPIRACALAYFDFARRRSGVYALMFDPAILREDEVGVARDNAFAMLQELIGRAASQSDRTAEEIHKVALAVFACGHGAATMTLDHEGTGASPLMEEVIQGLEVLFRRR